MPTYMARPDQSNSNPVSKELGGFLEQTFGPTPLMAGPGMILTPGANMGVEGMVNQLKRAAGPVDPLDVPLPPLPPHGFRKDFFGSPMGYLGANPQPVPQANQNPLMHELMKRHK